MSSGRLGFSLVKWLSACGLTSVSVDVRGQLSGNTATLSSFILEDPDKPTPEVDITVRKASG